MKFILCKGVGIFLVCMGIFFVSSTFSVTGLVVSDLSPTGFGSFLGFVCIAGGIFLFMAGLEKRVEIYSTREGGRERYYLTDPMEIFGSGGVDVQDFIDVCGIAREDKAAWESVRRTYIPPLLNIADSNGEFSEIARRILPALDIEYKTEEAEDDVLGPEKSREIINAFRTWNGKVTQSQKKILREFDLKYNPRGRHPSIYSERYGTKIPAPGSPSDSAHGGRNFAHHVLGVCREVYDRNADGENR